jgi:cytidyltransferase-like protein
LSAGRSLYEWGCVHGRFQPFHRGHLEYALVARERCKRLLVGVTNPDPTRVVPEVSNAHRHEARANPFTYFERALMVRDSLLGEGLKAREFAIVPFPIQEPESWRHYVPEGAVHFVRVYSGWEEEKVRRLRAHGFTVEILDSGKEKAVSGTEVRSRLSSGLPWEHLVPAAAIPIVQEAVTRRSQRFGAPTQR